MIDAMKLAVLYVRPGQHVLSDVFQNQPDPGHAFWKMMVSAFIFVCFLPVHCHFLIVLGQVGGRDCRGRLEALLRRLLTRL
jgi:hypothetical protein